MTMNSDERDKSQTQPQSNGSTDRFVHLPLLMITLFFMGLFLVIGRYRVEIDTDIVASLPTQDAVIADARHILQNQSIQNRIFIDIGLDVSDADALVEAGKMAVQLLDESGLFKTVGNRQFQQVMPELIQYVVEHLPILFNKRELENRVAPLLTPPTVDQRLQDIIQGLSRMDQVGQTHWISQDPLNLRNLVLERMAALAPSTSIQLYRGQLLSSDERHLLIMAEPLQSGTDTSQARALEQLFVDVSARLNQHFRQKGLNFTLTPVGAYRAALDNERAAKRDTQRAIALATAGIILLLWVAFPRPWFGLLCLFPAIFGTVAAFFIYSLIYDKISVLTLGFGGALISITVDHGIAFLLFLDRPFQTHGKAAAHETRSVGLIAMLTTVGGFLSLSLTGFPILEQIGQFTALGIVCSFVFVHSVFSRMFPTVSAASKKHPLPLQRLVDAIFHKGGNWKLIMAGILAAVMALFVKPEFRADLASMNTVTPETRQAESRFTSVWGNMRHRVFIMMEANTMDELLDTSHTVHKLLTDHMPPHTVAHVFLPSTLFPGPHQAQKNFHDWRQFWDSDRIQQTIQLLRTNGIRHGFSPNAFSPFFHLLSPGPFSSPTITPSLYAFSGIIRITDTGHLALVTPLTPGSAYNAESFRGTLTQTNGIKVFDPKYFGKRLGRILLHTFQKMVLFIGISVAVLVFVFFLDGLLACVAIAPVVFAFICTLGTLHLMGRVMDIPSLMLSIVVIAMGIDYSLFFVRSWQRYGDSTHPFFGVIRLTVFLASASTIAGFSAMSTATHALLKSAGITSLIGISYALFGAFLILPPVLAYIYRPKPPSITDTPIKQILARYRHLEAWPRIDARLRLMFDPVFSDLDGIIGKPPRMILCVGTGYGLTGAWLTQRFPNARVCGIEPDANKIRITSRILGIHIPVIHGSIASWPESTPNPDLILLLEGLPWMPDDERIDLLNSLYERLAPDGQIIIHARPHRPSMGSRILETISTGSWNRYLWPMGPNALNHTRMPPKAVHQHPMKHWGNLISIRKHQKLTSDILI